MSTSIDDDAQTAHRRAEPSERGAGGGASGAPGSAGEANRGGRSPFEAPRLERLGTWRALTLQQSVGIGPGNV